MSVPTSMRALITLARRAADVQEVPIPDIDDDEILVKVGAVAQNPTDWKHIDNTGHVGTICGCDFSGHVAKVGSKVTNVVVGDHVAGFTHGGYYKDRGAFAEYTKVSGDLVWTIPEHTLTEEEAATFGCAFWTAVQALFHPSRLGMVEPPEEVQHEQWIFIYGGSSSVGMFAIQLAHLADYKVVTVASPRNWELCKSLGADVVLDYHDPHVVDKIKEVAHNNIHLALDTIAIPSSQVLTAKAFGPGPGKMIVIQAPQKDVKDFRDDITIRHTLIYTALGREFFMRQTYLASPEDRNHMAQFLKKVPGFVSAGLIKPNPVKVWKGGLDGINAGLDYMREGKNSGEKVVYRISG
ncbi:GroES-like protein [Irpex rosettiformis]|uniref:GroES-like protein n=1 Tax=Irpex rosettiformis TaxID=378272 RepID=A0ACB8U4U3_9APHY|nr:GroES-like protein [Irpex rosettiformis]